RSFMFGTPKEMTVEEIEDVVERFVVAAKCVHSAGFKGVEVHGAHGYLLCKFCFLPLITIIASLIKMADWYLILVIFSIIFDPIGKPFHSWCMVRVHRSPSK